MRFFFARWYSGTATTAREYLLFAFLQDYSISSSAQFAIMGKLDLYEIVYSTQPAVFFPGQPVTGVVNVKLNDGMTMRNLRLKFEGKAYVSISWGYQREWTFSYRGAAPVWGGKKNGLPMDRRDGRTHPMELHVPTKNLKRLVTLIGTVLAF